MAVQLTLTFSGYLENISIALNQTHVNYISFQARSLYLEFQAGLIAFIIFRLVLNWTGKVILGQAREFAVHAKHY